MSMGFKSVYRCLQEIFPQVDARVLKAVAIEHPKDADAAVNDVLTDVLPYLRKDSLSPTYSPPTISPGYQNVELEDHVKLLRPNHVGNETHAGSPFSEQGCTAGENSGYADDTNKSICAEPQMQGEAENEPQIPHVSFPSDGNNSQFSGSPVSEEEQTGYAPKCNGSVERYMVQLVAPTECLAAPSVQECDLLPEFCSLPPVSDCEKSQASNSSDHTTQTEYIVTKNKDLEDELSGNSLVTQSSQECRSATSKDEQLIHAPECHESSIEVESSVGQLVAPLVKEQTQDVLECDLQSEFCSLPVVADCEKSASSNSSGHTSKIDYVLTEMEDVEDELSRNSIVTRSGQVCRIDILEEITEEAKNSKRCLFTAMESVINMMREVELQEKAAEQAKEEAAKGGLEILVKVEELKQMLAHANGANDMHAGEVYGERAILATEVRELQSRLLSLSDERDKALATLEEMHQRLEARLAAAEEVRKAAELEKLEKENSAKKALAEQEAIMEKVVQESKLLQQEAEENAKLREFLMDRGRTVDMLQGEISVVCMDVRLLKEKFDDRVPLSQSVSSSQTSCILASSGTSFKNMTHDTVIDHEQATKNLEKVNLDSLVNDSSPSILRGEDKVISNHSQLLEDDWDMFDKDIELDG